MLHDISPYLTPKYLLLSLFPLLILYNLLTKLLKAHRIARLGARAPIRTTYLPYGVDMLHQVITYALKDMNYELWLLMFSKYGKGRYTVEAGSGERVILTAEPDNVKAVLATQFKDFGKGERFNKDWKFFLGNGIFTVDGARWHESRQLIRPQFIKDRLGDLDIFEEHVQILMKRLGESKEIDMLDMFFRYTLDAATHFLLGQSVESLIRPQTQFADAFYNAQRVQSMIARCGPLNWLVPRKRLGFYDSVKEVEDFVNVYIERALAISPSELEKKGNHDSGYTFLHAIAGYTRDRTVLRDQLLSILLAGRDTTACTLTWTIYELSLRPDVQAKLRQEIIDHVGLEQAPTYQNLKDMKFLSHIINEVLRLYPVVPFNVRVALVDTTLPVGGGPDGTLPIGIPKGTPVGYSPLVMQRRADLYPPVESGFPPADKFFPERWDGWTPKSWTYIPFNGGPRICIGQQFALTEMGYTLVRLFQRFERVENHMTEGPGMHCDIVLQPAKEVRVGFY
ncbi:cytochrome P450 52A11 [Amniculicola lignicola CBS 123094]|uniref:Cytochrome P450 52A11 n=1 Tax=Amniculicola lignicola CBS 123094 TaxID=1392246 RepID=A0A6A5WIB9_9PLEO|nr:cytochrome P450 52A11 [Amniculicola lignicola CBS 123094]